MPLRRPLPIMVWTLQRLPTLDDIQLREWAQLLEERTGIQFVLQQKAWLESQLHARMREVDLPDYASYFRYVAGDTLVARLEWTRLVDRLSVKETSFFRHRDSFDYVRRYVQQKIDTQQLNNNFHVWSIGCATGEEPYSLAMVINDCLQLAAAPYSFGITALDISPSALATARLGRYTKRRAENMSEDEAKRYLRNVNNNQVEIVPSLRERVCFSHANIIDSRSLPHTQVDIIFCQNLLVYFRRWLRRDLLNQFVERLNVGGVLIVGLGEVMDWDHPLMQRVADDKVHAYVRVH